MVEISLSGSGEGPGWVTAPGYSTSSPGERSGRDHATAHWPQKAPRSRVRAHRKRAGRLELPLEPLGGPRERRAGRSVPVPRPLEQARRMFRRQRQSPSPNSSGGPRAG